MSIYIFTTAKEILELPLPGKVPMGRAVDNDIELVAGTIAVINEPLSGLIIEAEDFTYQDGGQVNYTFRGDASHTTNNPNGDAFYGWDNQGHVLEWEK